jgi:hypothetical protein
MRRWGDASFGEFPICPRESGEGLGQARARIELQVLGDVCSILFRRCHHGHEPARSLFEDGRIGAAWALCDVDEVLRHDRERVVRRPRIIAL